MASIGWYSRSLAIFRNGGGRRGTLANRRGPNQSYSQPRQLVRTVLGGLAVAAMGEVFFSPFGTAFRFTLGPLTLYILTLFFSMLPVLPVAVTAGVIIVAFHSITYILAAPGTNHLLVLAQALHHYGPEFIAYSVLGGFISLGQAQRRLDRPVSVVAILAASEFGCNFVELLVRGGPLSLYALFLTALTAVGRATLATGLFEVVRASERERRWDHERQEYARRLVFLSKLQTDIFFLRKSAREVEAVTERAHGLYGRLRSRQVRAEALGIARDIHEVKKDYQRTLASLSRLMDMPDLDSELHLREIVQLVVDTNSAYAQTLGKRIVFVSNLHVDFATQRYGRWITILNNLVTNSVEACPERGRITIGAAMARDQLHLDVSDTGSGVVPRDQAHLFQPGFSSKLNPETGAFSSGLGLTHVAELVKSMHGRVWLVHSSTAGTTFRVEVPWSDLEVAAEGGADQRVVPRADRG